MWMLPKKFDVHRLEDVMESLSIYFIAGTAPAFILLRLTTYYYTRGNLGMCTPADTG